MKKYVKPELFFESFELSQSIATCGIDVNFTSVTDNNCRPTLDLVMWGPIGGTNVFGQGRDDCATDISAYDVYCHTAGTSEAGRLFNS